MVRYFLEMIGNWRIENSFVLSVHQNTNSHSHWDKNFVFTYFCSVSGSFILSWWIKPETYSTSKAWALNTRNNWYKTGNVNTKSWFSVWMSWAVHLCLKNRKCNVQVTMKNTYLVKRQTWSHWWNLNSEINLGR